MSPEDRQGIIKALRSFAHDEHSLLSYAADELERLAALAQSDAEPVAWQWRMPDEEDWPELSCGIAHAEYMRDKRGAEIRPLYTAPPRPDTSAGLIAAAERELNDIRDTMLEDRSYYDGLIDFAGDIERVAAMLRARAADRSGK